MLSWFLLRPEAHKSYSVFITSILFTLGLLSGSEMTLSMKQSDWKWDPAFLVKQFYQRARMPNTVAHQLKVFLLSVLPVCGWYRRESFINDWNPSCRQYLPPDLKLLKYSFSVPPKHQANAPLKLLWHPEHKENNLHSWCPQNINPIYYFRGKKWSHFSHNLGFNSNCNNAIF